MVIQQLDRCFSSEGVQSKASPVLVLKIDDSNALIAFACIDKIPVLKALFSTVSITETDQLWVVIAYRLQPSLLEEK